MDEADRLAVIKAALNPERCLEYYTSQRWNDLVWCVEEIERLRAEAHQHDPTTCSECSGHPLRGVQV